jgi:hypothetical protein
MVTDAYSESMTEEDGSTDETAVPDAVARAFEAHDAFEPRPTAGEYDCTTTPFAVVATANAHDAEGRDARLRLRVELPLLDAVTEEEVGAAVAAGWRESLERHLTDAADVAEVDADHGPIVEQSDDRLELTVAFPAWTASTGVEALKTIVEYAEGSYLQAVIPGYTYQEPVASLLSRASERGGDDDGSARRGGTPL